MHVQGILVRPLPHVLREAPGRRKGPGGASHPLLGKGPATQPGARRTGGIGRQQEGSFPPGGVRVTRG
eukprot:5699709-Heterocapsa_arctica.AAC.1